MFNFLARLRPPAPRADARSSTASFDHGTPDGYDFFLQAGPARERRHAATSRATSAFWNEVMQHGTYDDFWKARNLRPHLKNIKPAVMTVGGWFDAENLFGALETYKSVETNSPGDRQPPGDGPLAPRRLEPRRRRDARRRPVQREDRRVLPRADRAPVLRAPPEGQGRGGSSPRRGSSRPARTCGASTTPGRRRAPSRRSLYLHAGGKLRRGPPPDARPEDGLDEYVSDPAKPVPFVDKIAIGMSPEYMTADQRFAARRPDVLVYQTDALERRRDPRRPDRGRAARLDDRDRLRLGRQADRRLSRRLPRPEARTRPACRWAATSSCVRGDVMRGKFRNSFEKPEPFDAGQADAGEVHAPGRLPHVPPRPPDHGAGPIELVPAGRPQPADVRRHLPGPRRPTSARRPSASTARASYHLM